MSPFYAVSVGLLCSAGLYSRNKQLLVDIANYVNGKTVYMNTPTFLTLLQQTILSDWEKDTVKAEKALSDFESLSYITRGFRFKSTSYVSIKN
jgi:hypothetical protein